jgi:hypothetical protein
MALRPRRSTTAARAGLPALLLLLALRVSAQGVAPTELERSVQRTMQSPDYAWRLPAAATSAATTPWIVTVTDRILESVKHGWQWTTHAIGEVVRWLLRQLTFDPETQPGAPPRGGLHWTMYALIAGVAALAALLAWRMRRIQRGRARPGEELAPAVRLNEEGLTADRLPESEWLELAAQCLREGELRWALRAYYLANLAWLGRNEFLSIHPGKTNREFEGELKRKARAAAEARTLFAANVAAYERAWYGRHEVSEEAVAEFRERAQGMQRLLPRGEAVA